MKNFLAFASAIILASCVVTPSALDTAAAVAAKPTQESLKSYFDFENVTNSNGDQILTKDESLQKNVNDCADKSINQYTQDVISETAENAATDAAAVAVGASAGSLLGGVLLAPIAVIAAPAALAVTAYSAVNTAAKLAERFEAEKEYALLMKQCISESGYSINFKELE